MTPDDPIAATFFEHSLVARVATRSPKGRPAMTPLWFLYDRGRLFLATGRDTVAARNAAANLGTTPAELTSRVQVSSLPGIEVLQITAYAASAEEAVAMADGLAGSLLDELSAQRDERIAALSERADAIRSERAGVAAGPDSAVELQRLDDELRIVLNRSETRNALNVQMRDEWLDALAVAHADPSLRVVVSGNGPSFCAGGDLDEFGTFPSPEEAHEIRIQRSIGAAIAGSPDADQVTSSTQAALMKSFSSAEAVAAQYPQYSTAITDAARTSFLDGADWAYLAGIVAVLVGATLVFFMFPRRDDERRLLAEYHAEDTARGPRAEGGAPRPAVPVDPAPVVALKAEMHARERRHGARGAEHVHAATHDSGVEGGDLGKVVQLRGDLGDHCLEDRIVDMVTAMPLRQVDHADRERLPGADAFRDAVARAALHAGEIEPDEFA